MQTANEAIEVARCSRDEYFDRSEGRGGPTLRRSLLNLSKIAMTLSVLVAAASGSVKAEEQEQPREFLKCISQCSDRRPPTGFPAMKRPSGPGHTREGLVDMMYTVAADGSTKDLRLVSVYGPEVYAETAMKEMANTHHVPATEGGQPIDFHGFETVNTYYRQGERIPPEYSKGLDLIEAGHEDAALEVFDGIATSSDASLRGRFMAAYQAATVYLEKNDLDQSLYYARIATMSEGRLLLKEAISKALHVKLLAAAQSGQYADALGTYDLIKKYQIATSQDTKLAGELEARIADTKPVEVRGWVHDDSLGGAWRHELFRRKFEFYKINGKLDHFELYCNGRELRSAIEETSAWVIPPSWSQCEIFVFGDAGATFQFYEQ